MSKYSLFVLFFCFISCQNKAFDEVQIIDMKNGNLGEIPISKHFISVDYIPLESIKETMLTPYAKFFVSEDNIVVIDREILLFDKKIGKFKNTVSRRGQGPGEYNGLMGASYYEISNTVLTNKGNQWLEINCETGLSQTIIKPNVSDFMVFSSNSDKNAEYAMFMQPILYTAKMQENCYIGYIHNINGTNPVKLIYYDREGAIVKKISNYLTFENNEEIIIQYSPFFYASNKSILFKEMFNDTIFHLAADTAFPVYVFNMGDKGLVYSEQDKEFDQKEYMVIKSFFENDDNFFFQYEYQSNYYVGVMNKNNNQIVLAKDGYVDDLNGFLHLYPNYQNMSGEVICVIPSERIVDYFEHTAESHISLNHLKNIQDDDNPVIAILTSK